MSYKQKIVDLTDEILKKDFPETEANEICCLLKKLTIRFEKKNLLNFSFEDYKKRHARDVQNLRGAVVAKKEKMSEQFKAACKQLDDQLKKRSEEASFKQYKKGFNEQLTQMEEIVDKQLKGGKK